MCVRVCVRACSDQWSAVLRMRMPKPSVSVQAGKEILRGIAERIAESLRPQMPLMERQRLAADAGVAASIVASYLDAKRRGLSKQRAATASLGANAPIEFHVHKPCTVQIPK